MVALCVMVLMMCGVGGWGLMRCQSRGTGVHISNREGGEHYIFRCHVPLDLPRVGPGCFGLVGSRGQNWLRGVTNDILPLVGWEDCGRGLRRWLGYGTVGQAP